MNNTDTNPNGTAPTQAARRKPAKIADLEKLISLVRTHEIIEFAKKFPGFVRAGDQHEVPCEAGYWDNTFKIGEGKFVRVVFADRAAYEVFDAAFVTAFPTHEETLRRVPAEKPAATKPGTRYVVESYDEDSESWDLVDEIPPCSSRHEAQEEGRYWASKLCGLVKTRAVEA